MQGGMYPSERGVMPVHLPDQRPIGKLPSCRGELPPEETTASFLTAYQRGEAVRRPDAGDAATEIARSFNVDRATTYRALASAGQP
jgi:hypothetical protein